MKPEKADGAEDAPDNSGRKSSRASRGRRATTSLESRLAEAMIAAHPKRAAVALERLGVAATVDFFEGLSIDQLAGLVPMLSPQFGAEAMTSLSTERLSGILSRLPLDVGSRITRLLGDHANAAIDRLDSNMRDGLQDLLRFPEDSAGGLMDPLVLALSEDLTAAEALERVRELSENARYNLNIVSREQTLVGVLNLRELLLAQPDARLSTLMVTNPQRLRANASRANIIAHPGWRQVHALPVVDDEDRYLGTIRFKTLRRLEETLHTRDENQTAQALGDLLAVGAGGLVRALTGFGPAEDQ